MTQIIFQAIVACCCTYTTYRLSLFIFRKLFRGGKSGKDACDVPVETAGMTKADNRDDGTSGITFEMLEEITASKSPESGFYRSVYLVRYPVSDRMQVYISRENYSHIKRFLAVVAPGTPISSYVNRIVGEHLKIYGHEMSELYTECINKPL